MRLAFLDLMFSWPPHGGADVDLYHTLEGLQALGHKVRLFGAAYARSWERGKFDPRELPFPATRLEFSALSFNRRQVPARFRASVDAWRPQAVCIADGFFLKPYLARAMAHYPTIGRYYAYEIACPRDMLLYKDGQPCPNNYLRKPELCRRCALAGHGEGIKHWRFPFQAWTHEYLVARAFMPHYHPLLVKALRGMNAVIVYNSIMKGHLDGFNDAVHILPGGVDVNAFAYQPPVPKEPGAPTVIFMSGRIEDPVKGLDTLIAAGERLATSRSDFEIQVTHRSRRFNIPWLKSVGWLDRDALMEHHRQADICVVPSVWEEPFGLTAVEAMAVGRPVCAGRVGGLQDIVRHGETGLLFDRGDSAGLAQCLAQLMDDADLRRRMGEAGRRVVEQEYDWPRIVERYWPPLLEGLVQ